MTHQNSKIAIEYLFNFINNLPPSINIKDITGKNSIVSTSRQAIMSHYFYKEFNDPENQWVFTNRCKKMTKPTVLKLGYIYKRLLCFYEFSDTDIYHNSEQWFIRQVITCNQNLNNPDFENIDLHEIYNIEWD